jgi:RNase P/RNase MRP subunit POP5
MVRVKYRFIIAQLLSANQSDKERRITVKLKDIQQSIKDKTQELYGDIGMGEIAQTTTAKYLDSHFSHIFIVKTLRELETEASFIISCINRIKDEDIVIRTISIKSCERTAIEEMKAILVKVVSNLDIQSESERVAILENLQKSLDLIAL